MIKIKEVKSYVTSDGSGFLTMDGAEKHQVMLDLRDAFKAYQDGRPGGMSMSGFFDFIKTNRVLVVEYLAS